MSESERTFDRETLLDLTVNVIPLGIILFFIVVFLLVRPWEWNPFITAISMGLLIVPFVALALLTYVSGRAVSEAEGDAASATAIDDSFEESAVESGETETSADMNDGVTDDEAAALSDGSDTGEDDADESTADAETSDATEDDSESEGHESDEDESDGEN